MGWRKWMWAMAGVSTLAVGCGDGETSSPEGLLETATIQGRLMDSLERPVAGATAIMMSGEQKTEFRAEVNADGTYELAGVPINLLTADEATILFESPRTDLAPFGTVEGDYVHEMPISVDEFVEPLLIGKQATLLARPAYVPLQAKGYTIDDNLVVNGGELSWDYADDGMRGEMKVTLRIAPGSIQMPAGDVQTELTMTPVDLFKSPMEIPEGGAGALWTIQPRDIIFDPPAQLVVEGQRVQLLGQRNADAQVGDEVEIFGATFTEGWAKFGDATLMALDDEKVTLESNGGIIHKGAWGHVFGAPGTNAGILVQCQDCAHEGEEENAGPGLKWVTCQIDRDLSAAQNQRDWEPIQIMRTDNEIRCSRCGNPNWAVAAVGLSIPWSGAEARLHITQAETGEAWTFPFYDIQERVFDRSHVVNFCEVDGYFPTP